MVPICYFLLTRNNTSSKYLDIVYFFILDEEQLRTEPDVHLVFELKVKCTRNPDAPKDCANPEIMYLNNKGNSFYFVMLL